MTLIIPAVIFHDTKSTFCLYGTVHTQAYTFLVRQAGFEEFPVSAADHEWGVIKLDGKYYFVDCTWDSKFEPYNYEYFAFGLDKRIADGFLEDEMYIGENDEMKLGDYAKIERENYKL